MFRLFRHIGKDHKVLVEPDENSTYNVVESHFYSFEYTSESGRVENVVPYFEDDVIYNKLLLVAEDTIKCRSHRLFDCYFGFSVLTIGDESFRFNVLIEKMKTDIFEDMLRYIWSCNTQAITRFSSKSFVEYGSNKNNDEYLFSTRFTDWCEEFCKLFIRLYYNFKQHPHSLLRRVSVDETYEPQKVSYESIDWIMHNLDELCFDISYANHPDAIEIDGNYAIPNIIRVEKEKASYDTYENNLIIGMFDFVLNKIKDYSRSLEVHFATNERRKESEYVDIRELTFLPYLRLRDKKDEIERRIKLLKAKYIKLFPDAKSDYQPIRLTSIFMHKQHYNEAYRFIKNKLANYDFNSANNFPICNIKKLSRLYEYFNLYKLRDILAQNGVVGTTIDSTDEENIPKKIIGTNDYCEVSLYYEPHIKYMDSDIEGLRSVSKCDEGENISITKYSYKPDFVIEIRNTLTGQIAYHIFDAKYTTNKYIHGYLKDCAVKYLIGINPSNRQMHSLLSLSLLYPEGNSNRLIRPGFNPELNYFSSNTNSSNDLESYIQEILNTSSGIGMTNV